MTPARTLALFAAKVAIVLVPLGLWLPDLVRSATETWVRTKVAAYAELLQELGRPADQARQGAIGRIVLGGR
jgi:hypothetical protein